MGTISIWSGLSTAGLAYVKVAEGHWRAQRPTADLHVVVIEDQHPVSLPFQLENFSRKDLAVRLKLAGQRGAIAMTVDTYLMLALELQVIEPGAVTTVFPWPADEPCTRVPEITIEADATCRDVARYYHALSHRRLIDQHGKVQRFLFKAANTVSFRAHADYFNIRREDRATFRPIGNHESVVQFDWTAAEWSLILQENGYTVGDDAYALLTKNGIDRPTAKAVALEYVFGASIDRMNERWDPAAVAAVIKQISNEYPEVLRWKESIRRAWRLSFNGFEMDLGSESYKRANRWSQTVLQLCKWDLLSRLMQIDGHRLAAGDLHDQLFFHVDRLDPASSGLIEAVKEEIRKPYFGKITLIPKFKEGSTWGDPAQVLIATI